MTLKKKNIYLHDLLWYWINIWRKEKKRKLGAPVKPVWRVSLRPCCWTLHWVQSKHVLDHETSVRVCWHAAANFLWCNQLIKCSQCCIQPPCNRLCRVSQWHADINLSPSTWAPLLTVDRHRRAEVLGQRTNPCQHVLPYSLSPTCQSPTLLSPCSPCSPCSPLQTLHPWR